MRKHGEDEGSLRWAKRVKVSVYTVFLLLCIWLSAGLPALAQSEVKTFDIAAGPLSEALNAFGIQAGIGVGYDASVVAGRTTPGLRGSFPVTEALDRLLAGTGLIPRFSGAGTVSVARAENSSAAEEPAGFDDLRGEDIVVTARRFEEALSDVPGSVVVLTGEELEQSGIDDPREVISRLPNVNFTEGSSPAGVGLSIRGISNLIGDDASGPTVGVFADGILLNPTGSTLAINPTLFDLERVETIFGPQGTAFGRGTIGGAINFVPKKPTEDYEFSLELESGVFEGANPFGSVRAVANLPILEDGLLSARVIAFGEVSEGFIDIAGPVDENSIGNRDFGARLSLRSEPTDRLKIDFSASYDRSTFDAGNSATQASVAAGDPVLETNLIDPTRLARRLFSLKGTYDFDFGSLTSTTGFLTSDLDGRGDTDSSAEDFLTITTRTEIRSTSQELRFESEFFELPMDLGEIAFNIGTSASFNNFFDTFVLEGGPEFIFIPGVPPAFLPEATLDSFFEQNVFSVGVFGDFRWQPIPELEIAAGVRFNRDRVEAESEQIGTGLLSVGFSPFMQNREVFSAFTPNASIRYEWSENLSTHFAYTTGFRAGGFNLTTGPLATFDEERVRSLEAGFSAQFFDDRLALRGSGFFIDYNDIQVAAVVPSASAVTVVTTNAATARSFGTELGITALPFKGLRLSSDIGLNFATFTDFDDAPDFDADGAPDDLTGTTLPNAPRTTFSFVGDYEHPKPLIGDMAPFIRAEYTRTGEFTNILNPDIGVLDSYDLVNFRLGLRSDDLLFEGFVENALNEVYATGTVSFGAAAIAGVPFNLDVQPTRRFGVRLRKEF